MVPIRPFLKRRGFAMTSAKPASPAPVRRPSTNLAAFLVGVPLSRLRLLLFHKGPLLHSLLFRYLERPVEGVELILFCCAVSALGAKWLQSLVERRACQDDVLPPWNGQPLPLREAVNLRAGLQRLPQRLQNTF